MTKLSKMISKEQKHVKIKGVVQFPDIEHCDKEPIKRPIMAVALSPEEVNDVLRKIERKIAEYEQEMNA